MNRKKVIDELKKMKLIAHRLGYQMTEYPENSLEGLKTIFRNAEILNSCDGFEFDIRFTKDHIPVIIHDKYIDDITDSYGLVSEYTLEELKKINFGFRKSLKGNNDSISYKIISLEEILLFFENNISSLEDKIIKIETKDYVFTTKNNFNTRNLIELSNILNKFPNLFKNIIHLSYWPLNLLLLKKIQKKNNYQLIRNDLLCDYSIIVFLTRFMPYLDNISLRIKTTNLAKIDSKNSKRVNRKIKFDLFWMKFANAIKEKNLEYAINKYGTVGIYTLNDYEEIDEICKHITDGFFNENSKNIVVTTNNPLYLKKDLKELDKFI